MEVAGKPDYDNPQIDHLWLLTGGGDYFDGGTVYYLGPDVDVEGEDLAGPTLERRLGRREMPDVDPEQAWEALATYREYRSRQRSSRP